MTKWVRCKCGNEIEINDDCQLHEVICSLCDRTGCVEYIKRR